ncbi:hypothetical protein LPW26_22695 [Rhodopseudomonas sp. HC1]|uniref:hypothetical protein n=1 Tax=Rhodopseudomonas infernalis TaxID=2897386 RepID=UPI001EE79C26|nr:hypothetical protein [Rhodopseudomonas infernalis]MCG6207465.1 hypothetical protein [Rhodopseudomonas infernalis]
MPKLPASIAFAAAGLLASAAITASADTTKGNAMTVAAHATETSIGSAAGLAARLMPSGYQAAARRFVSVDGERAELVRYERADNRNAALGGEHFSTVMAADGRLKGFARMDLALVGGALPSREETQAIAMDFLREAAPDLLPVLKISWIEPHDEPLRVMRNGKAESLTLTGMKVKMRNSADGRWMWVIVGTDRKVMVFERDIVWVTFPGHRQTEKWLHDSWLAEKGFAARAS